MTDGQLLEGFIARRDAAAFELLVRRYGPLVYRVCGDILSDPNDIEDAFQATFLVLIRRAGAIRERESVGRWLYETAYRIAVRSKVNARRRQSRERQGVEMVAAGPELEAEGRELRPLVHAELNRLPETLRAPLVLCYLEGRSYEEAARRLRLPLGTLKGRLVKGRELLRSRLMRRGVGASALALLAVLSETVPAVPAELVETTVRTGVLSGLGGALPLPATLSPRLTELVRAELRSRSLTRLGQVALGLSALAVITLSTFWVAPAVADETRLWVQALLPSSPPKACHAPPGEPDTVFTP